MAWVGLAWAQPVVNALPNAGQVVRGAASMVQSTHQLSINQTSQRAAINWQSFDIGAGAKVNVIQPNAQAVLLNRVIGQNPSQIFGQLQANGQVILVNPNGVLFGKDGSVNAGGFTASTLGITDANFMAGNMVYERNGSTAGVVNRGSIQVMPGGYVALLGASVSNEGKIIASQGGVAMGAAETIKVPVSGSGRIKLELSAADINASVSNAGQIVAEGGQVYLQALALNRAAAQVIQSGSIDTSGEQAGQVHLLADGGAITVGGSIMANSSGTNNKGQTHKGGDIVIGRDEDTGVLARYTDVSGANLESKQGFVETSGEFLKSNGVQIKAGQWLLDPTDITIVSADTAAANTPKTTASGTDTYQQTGATNTSEILNTDISAALSNGTNVLIKTTNASATGNGDITVAANISATSATAQDATLTLQAERDIVVNSNVSIARTGSNKLNVILNSDLDGNGTGAIVMNTGSSISSNGGNITLGGGTAGTGADYARGYTDATRFTGVSLIGSTLTAAGGDISIKGKGNTTFTNSSNMRGVDLSGTAISTSGSGNITIDGVGGNGNISNTNVGVGITGASTLTGSSGGTVTLTGTAINGGYYNFGVWLSGAGSTVTSLGGINVTGTGGGSGGYGSNPGVMVQNSAAISATGSGNLTVTGTGGNTTGPDNHGVQIVGSGVLSSANGDVTINGTSGTFGSSSFGVTIGSAGQVTTNGGHVNVTATSRINGQYGYGLWIGDTNSKISVGGNGNATINAFSSATGSTDALGAQIRSIGAVTTNNGNINLTGMSRGATGNYNIGVGFNGGSLIAGGTGTVTVTGTGGSVGNYAYGVSGANITTSGGAINIIGSSSSTGTGTAAIDATGNAISSSGGNITMTGDSYYAGTTETINAGSGTVTIQNRTAGTLIDVGATSADVISGTLKLGVSSAELARITAATFVVGRNDGTGSGNVNLTATNLGALGNTGGNLTVLSGNNIAINGAITKSTGTDATLTLNAVNGIDITNAAASVGGTVAGAGKLNVAMTANGNAATVANSSGLVLTKTINANGGTVTLSGTNKQNAGGSGNSGVRFTGASIYAGSLTVTGYQTGAITNSERNGIHFSGANLLQTASGTSTLTGNSNDTANLGAGIFFAESSSTTLDSGTGSINFSGLNSNTGYRGIRIGGGNLAFINAKGNITFEDTQNHVFLRGQLTQQANTTVNFKGKFVSFYSGASVVKASGATGTTLNVDAQTLMVGETGSAALTADTINLTGNTTTAAATGVQIINASTLTSSGATTITASGPGTSLDAVSTTTIAATGGLTVNINNAGTLGSLLTGGAANAGGLTKQGAGTLTVGNTNTHQGTTFVSAGTLQLNNVNALQNSTLDTGTSGTQQVTFGVANTNTYNLGGLQGADALAIGANTISVGANNSSTTYSGVLSGTGDLTKVGTGNLTLSGQSTKTGNYNANGGTLTLTGATGTYRSLNGVNVNINNGATVNIPTVVNGGFVSENVTWTFGSTGGGTLTNSANFVNRGTNGNRFVTTGGATNTINGNINLDFATNLAGPTFDVAEGAGGVAGLIHAGSSSNGSATQGFIKNGSGTLQLSGANNYKGPVTINAGTVELTGAGTLGSSVASMAIANAGIFKSSSTAAQTIAGIISGQGSVIQAGTGTMTLSGNNTYSGGTTINSGSTLNVGSGGAMGSLGTGAVLDNGLLTFNRSNSLTVANVISGSGALTQAGAGTTILTADNSYSGTSTISAGTLQVGNGGSTGTLGSGDVAMSNNANLSFSRAAATTIGNSISGAGNVLAAITGASSTLNVSSPINLTNGTVNLATDSHLSVTAAISTTNTSDSAVILNAGASTSAGTSTGGNLAFTGGGNVTVGAGGRATLMTGSISDSTGLTSLVGSGSGRFRYNSDETNPNYTTALGAGLNAIYREAPTLTATLNNAVKTYDGLTYSGGNGLGALTGYVNGDAAALLGSVTYGGAAQSAKNVGSYVLSGTVASGAGYLVTLNNATLTVNKADLVLSGTRAYDGSQTFAGQFLTATGVNNESFALTGLGHSSNLGTKNVQSQQVLSSLTGLSLGASNGINSALSSNYNAISTTGSSVSVTRKDATVTGTATQVTYNGNLQNQQAATSSGFVSGDSISITGLASGKNAATYASNLGVTGTDAANYNITFANADLVIGKANLVLSGTREYDASKTFAGSFLTATGVGGESFAITGAGDASNLSSKNVQTNQLLASLTGLSLGASNGSNAGVSSNYNAISTTGSSVSVTAKAATVTGTATNVTYNGSSQTQSAASSTGFIAGDAISFSGAAAGKNAGTYTSNLFVGGTDATNYSVTVNNADLVIAKAPLTVTASQVSKTYDGGLGASGTGTVGALAGAAAGDLVNSAGTQVFLDKNAGTGKTVRASGVTIKDASNADMGGNYHITYVDNTTSSISKAALTVTANSDARFVTQTDATGFNGVSYSGFVGGETSSVLGGTLAISRTNAPATQGAGSYSGVLQASGLSSGNYEISYANGNYTIVPANQLLIKTNNTSVTYGSLPTFNTTAQYLLDDGVHPSQVVTLTRTGSGGAYSFHDGAGGSVSMTLKPYVMDTVIQAATSTSQHTVVGNYDIKDHSPTVVGSNFVGSPVFVGALTVDTKAVTPNATGVSKVYDATTSMNNVVIGLTGKVTADELNISGAGAFSQRHVGSGLSYTVSGIALDGADAANYHLSGGSTSLTGSDGVITAAELKITTSDVSKTYDRSLSAQGSAQATGGTQLFGSDSLSGGSFAFTNWNAGAGNKVVTVADVTLNDGNGGLNYVVTYVDNTTSTITPKSLTASYSAANKTYNGNRTASVTGSSSDVISGDTVNFSNTSANFDTKNVGVGKTVSISGISISGADSGNYSLQSTSASSTADISVKNLTASFTASSKTYDGNLVANVAGSSSDIVGSDAITFTTTGAQFDTKDAGTGKVVSVAGIGLSGADAANYSLQNTSASTTGTITPKDVSITSLSASNKVYDGSRSATIASGVISTGVGSETLLISGHGTFSDKNAGTDKTVTVDDVTTLTKSDGTGDWHNYKLVSTGSMTTSADITQAALTVTANAVTKTYDSTLTASGAGTAGALAGAGDVVNNVGQQAFLDKNAGTGKTVRASGVTIKDASNADMTGNYLITYVDNTTSVIQQAALELSTSNVVKTYDGLLTANGTATVNSGTLLSGDNLSGGSFAFTDKNQGQGNKTVTVSGVTVGDGTHNDNYAVTYTANTTSTIQKAALTVTANAEVKTYDGSLSASGTATVGALAGSGDAVNSAGSQAFLNKNAGSSKTVRAAGVTIKDANNVDMSGNYVITYVDNTTSTINKAQLSAALVSTIQKEYDGTTATASDLTNANYAVSGWASVAGVSEGASVNQKAATYANANVANNRGTGAVTATLGPAHFTADAGTDLGNYLLPTSASGNVGLITPAALTVKVNNTAMFVTQDPNSAFDQGFGFVGLKNGESGVNVVGTLTRSYSGAANPATGSYTSVYGLTAAPTADNYTVTVQKGDLTVVAADKLLINVGGKSESYGALTAANAGASANTVVAQYCLVSSDCNGANLANLTMTRQGGLWTATDVSNSTVRFNTVVDTAGHISGGGYLNAGSYAYAVDGLTTSGAVNFNGTAVSGGSLTVEAQRLTLSASNVSKVYDGTNALDAMALTPAGVLSGDTVGVRSSGGSFGSKNAGAQTFSLTGLQLQGSDRANYFFAGQSLSGTGTITPKALSVAASAVDKVYDGTTAANGSLSALNVIGQDEVLLSWGPVQFASKNVSRDAQGQVQAQAVNFDGVQLSGVDAGNYSVSPTASSNAKITPKLLSVNGTRVANKTQDGDTETSVQLGLLSGLVGTEALQMQAAANFESPDVGINKPVNVRYSLANGANDGLGGNYELPVQRLSANIFAKSGGNVVQPIVIPTNANKATSRVVASKGAGALARFGAATVSANQSENADVCSVATPESCLCQQTGLAGVEICFPGHPKPHPALLEKGN